MKHFSNHMDEIKLSSIRVIGERAAALAAEGQKILKLQVGEPDFDTARHVIQALEDSLGQLETRYTPNRGMVELRKAIAEKLKKDNGITYDPKEEILVLNGCAEALFCCITGLVDPGDEVIIIEPGFLSYEQIIRIAHATPVTVRAKEENNWLPAAEDIKKAITPKTRMLVLNSPNNPTGAVYPQELLQEIADLAKEHDFFVASDEVYEKLVYDESKHISIASLDGMWERTIVINGFSKAYAMTGWRLGYVAAPATLILPMLKVHQYTTTCLPAFVQKGALDAIRNSDEDIEKMRLEYMRRRDLLVEYFNGTDQVSMVVPKGTFYIYLNIAKSGLNSTEFAKELLEKEGVATIPDTAFDHSGSDMIRVSFASDETTLRIGAEKIAKLASQK